MSPPLLQTDSRSKHYQSSCLVGTRESCRSPLLNNGCGSWISCNQTRRSTISARHCICTVPSSRAHCTRASMRLCAVTRFCVPPLPCENHNSSSLHHSPLPCQCCICVLLLILRG